MALDSFTPGRRRSGRRVGFRWPLLVAMAALIVVKHLLVSTLPILVYSNQKYDDAWMVDHAVTIRANQWLGSYDQLTLVKGPFGPFFLAVSSKLGISFLTAEQSLHTLACVVVVVALAPVLKSSVSRLLLFAALLFDPISWAAWTFQRVYRSGLTVSQALIIVACMSALFLRRDRSLITLLPWSIGAGLGIASMWHNREDSVWIMPFVLIATMVLIIGVVVRAVHDLRSRRETTRSVRRVATRSVGAVLVFSLPIAMLMGSNALVSRQNENEYGLRCYNEINDCHFPEFMHAVYSVAWDTSGSPERVDVPLAKWKYLYTLSPTLNSISDSMDWAIHLWSHKTGNVQNGMLIWPIRDAVRHAGYYQASGPKGAAGTDRLYEKMALEIESAISSGKAESQPTMPSSLMPPWHSAYSREVPADVKRLGTFVMSFEGVEPAAEGWNKNEIENQYFAGITGDRSIDLASDSASVEIQYLRPVINHLNSITKMYSAVSGPLAVLSIVLWLVMLALFFRRDLRQSYHGEYLLISAGIAGSILALVVGVSYNDVASVKSSYYMYLSGAYPLYILFVVGTICVASELLCDLARRRQQRASGARGSGTVGQTPSPLTSGV